ncbi:MAG: hypothetical protein AVDCRST_MAG49-1842 [uncultured Thermomicrobiales bacterium]|uniref:Uncharacterized protein n=1 Tax=uncultured Thermomicrobiales bacterium TaxID=1645740 RepID=A0A6J4ULZ0_9BACT|nr:MAG: hypothetical protein AVDCRST_MAG49-1842 [uncultured Thermomicrobiales bacterium]
MRGSPAVVTGGAHRRPGEAGYVPLAPGRTGSARRTGAARRAAGSGVPDHRGGDSDGWCSVREPSLTILAGDAAPPSVEGRGGVVNRSPRSGEVRLLPNVAATAPGDRVGLAVGNDRAAAARLPWRRTAGPRSTVEVVTRPLHGIGPAMPSTPSRPQPSNPSFSSSVSICAAAAAGVAPPPWASVPRVPAGAHPIARARYATRGETISVVSILSRRPGRRTSIPAVARASRHGARPTGRGRGRSDTTRSDDHSANASRG